MIQKNTLWGKLKKFLIDKEPFIPNNGPSMNLFLKKENEEVVTYQISEEIFIKQKVEKRKINFEEKNRIIEKGIDSTGYLYWPAEEILGYFCFKNKSLFQKIENIIELGAGKSGFAGITVGRMMEKNFKYMLITDGKEEIIEELKQNVILNDFQLDDELSPGCATIKHLLWSNDIQLKIEGENVILIADCLFFEQYHQELILTIKHFLSKGQNSFCLICAPNRGGSLKRFLDKINGLQLDYILMELQDEFYQQQVQNMKADPSYDEDRHLMKFVLVKLLKQF